MLVGFALAGVYLLSAVLSGRLDVFARRPLLDTGGVPPPYRWVAPPPLFAETNLKPDSKRQAVPFKDGTLQGEFVATDDGQASMILPKGAVAAKPNATAAEFTIEPRDPAAFEGYPRGYRIRGNVYEIRGTYVGGGGGEIATLPSPVRVILSYPSHTAEFVGTKHEMIQSSDGKTWKILPIDNDSPVALQIAVSSSDLGFFTVIAKPNPVEKPRSSSPFIIISLVILVAGLAGTYAWRTARIRAANLRKRKTPRQLPKNQRRRR